MAKEKYKESWLPKVVEYAILGLSNKQIAKNLDISEETFYQYMKKYPEFSEAIQKGKADADKEVENAIYKRAVGYEFEEKQTEYDVDNKGVASIKKVKSTKKMIHSDTAAIFWLKNRNPEKWQEKNTTDHQSSDGTMSPIDFTGMSEEEKQVILKLARNQKD